MDPQHFTHEKPTCICGAQLGPSHSTLCRKCVARIRWNRRHLARGGHGGADKGIRTRRARRAHRRDGGDA
ncbi:hypothetical protein ODJ79_28605 [Actinoplanes sp. KI2]|uniref:hypothetical protein n=1 Tax=Actinoplanes sp. KI2 TaxID=2983315 RepID=UPI0021D5F47A|nr:hypothetical protein [Actinoplanes sp. KI2]MCU7727699.1 hypothetical protein [Actinoplanes sp. KI2]